MNKDRVKGKIDEVVGSARRHLGNLTGDSRTQVEGGLQQIKGRVETAVGKIKDAARDATDKAHAPHEINQEVKPERR